MSRKTLHLGRYAARPAEQAHPASPCKRAMTSLALQDRSRLASLAFLDIETNLDIETKGVLQ